MKTVLLAFAAFMLTAAKPAPPPATPLDPLPLEAQVMMDKGIDMARAGDYAKAIALFEQARSKAPDSAALFLNRGLAESKVPGREFRAIAFFGAYLDANPAAPNAAAVKQVIRDTRTRADATWATLARGYLAAAGAAGDSWHADKARGHLAQALIANGDLKGAEATIAEITSASTAAFYRLLLAEAKAAGDAAGAREQVDIVEKSGETGDNYRFIAALSAVALAQSKTGDRAGAASSLALLAAQPKRYTSPGQRSDIHTKVARAQFAAGDKEGAAASVRESLIYAQEDKDLKAYYISHGGELQAEFGDLDGARATAAALAGEEYHRAQVLMAVARAQVKGGDVPAALVTVGETADFMSASALVAVAEEQIKSGQAPAGLSTLTDAFKASQTLKGALDRTIVHSNIAFFQIQAGDITAARATLEIARKSQKKIPLRKGGGITGPAADQQYGARTVNDKYREIEWKERPWTKWTYHLSESLTSAPFPDVAQHVKTRPASFSTPHEAMNAIATALDALPKEGVLIDQMLAGGPPY